MMNKLDGFLHLKELGLPTVPFKFYQEGTSLSEDKLWTLRLALYNGVDFNLPRAVGVTAAEGEAFAKKQQQHYGDNGIIIYYPYFIASKSGTLSIRSNQSIIEAVAGDLWHLVTEGKKDTTWFLGTENTYFREVEKKELLLHEKRIKGLFYSEISSGREVLMEWSFAFQSNLNNLKKEPEGEENLVFYELRII